jgi:protocatechuate 3,4-dioxygenase beta subunit
MSHSLPDQRPPADFLARRATIGLIGSALAAAVFGGCSGGNAVSGSSSSSSGSGGSGGSSGSSSDCSMTSTETAGPYPGDGTNTDETGTTIDVLSLSGIVRSDIRADIGGTNLQSGVPLTVQLTLENLNNGCSGLAGYWIYIWHCSSEGYYSAYEASTNNGGHNYEGTSFLRGAQQTDSNGQVTFTTIFPGRYTGRVNHIHAEVFSSAGLAAANSVLVSQFCFDDSIDAEVDSSYSNTNSASLTNTTDGVFGNKYSSLEFALTGDITTGYTATATIGIAV